MAAWGTHAFSFALSYHSPQGAPSAVRGPSGEAVPVEGAPAGPPACPAASRGEEAPLKEEEGGRTRDFLAEGSFGLVTSSSLKKLSVSNTTSEPELFD